MADSGSPWATLEIVAHPRAASDGVGPVVDGVLHVRTTRPPTEGEANAAVTRLAARALRLAPSRLRLVAGARGRRKRFSVAGVSAAELDARLNELGESGR